jgi:hypothetical protein
MSYVTLPHFQNVNLFILLIIQIIIKLLKAKNTGNCEETKVGVLGQNTTGTKKERKKALTHFKNSKINKQ